MIRSLPSVVLLLLSAWPIPTANQDPECLRDLTRRSEVVAVGKLVHVDPPLGLWSGYHSVVQYARYEVVEVIKGKLAARDIYVAHGVVYNSPTGDTEKAQLSPKLFKNGKSFVLFLVSEEGKDYLSRTHPAKAYFSLDEKLLPKADAETVKRIRQYVGTK